MSLIPEEFTDYPEIVTEEQTTYATYEAYSLRPETYIVPIVFSLIFVVGVIGNGALVFIYFRQRSMRTVPNTFVLSLAIGDLLVMFVTVPFTGSVYTVESWPFGEVICVASEYVQDLSIGVSVFTLAVLSAERYWAIVDPLGKALSKGSRATMTTISCIWLIASLLALPIAVNTSVQTHRANVTYFDSDGETYNMTIESFYCSPYPAEWFVIGYPQGVVICRFLIYYAIPLVVIAYYYSGMAMHLMRQAREIPGEVTMSHGNTLLVRKKVAKMVLMFILIFFLCFTPHYIFVFWFWFHEHSENSYTPFWHGFRILGFCLSYGNSCVNPVALVFFSRTYRKYFREYVIKCSCFHKDERTTDRVLIERGTSLRTTKSEIIAFPLRARRDET